MAFLYKRKYKSGKTTWVIYYRVGNKQRSKVIGETDKRTAEKVFTKFCAELASGDFGITEIRDITLANYRQEYLKSVQSEKAERTIDREKQILKIFLEYFNNRQILLRSITSKDIKEYRNERLEKVSQETINLEFRHLKAFFNTAQRLGYIKENPFTYIKPVRVSQSDLPRFLDLEEIEKVREAFKGDDFELLVEFYLLTGVRLNEAITLNWDNINTRNKQIIIHGEYTKSKKHRIISYKDDKQIESLLNRLEKRDDNLLFGPRDNAPQWSYWWVSRKIALNLDRIGFPWATCHTFRHTYISHLVMAGVPLTTVKEIVGHSSINTTLKYAHLAPSHTSEMLQKRPY
ncbi:MAG: site-specific integrase [Calditrichaeota bacterium]|nr:site-specific integrase [Calditrichota bacterium]